MMSVSIFITRFMDNAHVRIIEEMSDDIYIEILATIPSTIFTSSIELMGTLTPGSLPVGFKKSEPL